MTTTALIRVSTEKQDPSSQRRAIEEWSLREGVVIDEWIDEGSISGALNEDKRPQLAALMTSVRRRCVQTLVITEWSRLGRDARYQVMRALELQTCGVRVIALDDAREYDLDDPDDLILFFLNVWKDHKSRIDTRRRTIRGVSGGTRDGRRLSVNGNVLGPPRLTLDPVTMGEVRARRDEGETIEEIARSIRGVRAGRDVPVSRMALWRLLRSAG